MNRLDRRRRLGARRQQQSMPAPPQEVPSPFGGLNTRDALNAMPINDAVRLDNMFPVEGFVRMRNGYLEQFDTGETGETIESIFQFWSETNRQLIIAVDGRLYEGSYTATGSADTDVANALVDTTTDFSAAGVTTNSIVKNTTDGTYATVSGIATTTNPNDTLNLSADIFPDGTDAYQITTPIGTGFSSDRWDAVNFNGYLILANGNDTPQNWDGSTLAASTFTGPTTSTLAGVESHKFRLYFWTGDDQSFWYASPNAISGALTEFDLSRVTGIGGNLINIKSWTIDSGSGPDDFLALIFSSGVVVVYQGSDPGSAANWAFVGKYKLPEPLGGNRCATKIGGDLKIITKADIVSMTATVQQGYENIPRTKISGAVRTAAALHASSFGWEIALHPEGHMLVINQPDVSGSYNQFVQNTTTGAWCRFTNLIANCWGQYNGRILFGNSTGKVMYLTGYSDNGSNINADAIQAWNSLQTGYDKLINQYRLVLATDGDINYGLKTGFEFEDIEEPATSAVSSTTGSEWDVTAWDEGGWSDPGIVYKAWRTGSGEGQYISARIIIKSQQQVSWLKTDYRVSPLKNA